VFKQPDAAVILDNEARSIEDFTVHAWRMGTQHGQRGFVLLYRLRELTQRLVPWRTDQEWAGILFGQ
jgi:hypothetical protein